MPTLSLGDIPSSPGKPLHALNYMNGARHNREGWAGLENPCFSSGKSDTLALSEQLKLPWNWKQTKITKKNQQREDIPELKELPEYGPWDQHG